jgi:hypothetical protein
MTMLQPLVTYNFHNTIWRMEIDDHSDIMVLELRNEQEKQVSFASLNLRSGEQHFTDYKTEERWLTGVEGVYGNVALLHYYKHETGPEHKGVIAIDAVTSAALWSNYSMAFDHLSINGPVAYNTNLSPKKLLLADIKTGEVLRSYESADKPLPNNIVIPTLTAASQFVPGMLPDEPYGNIVHYLNHNNYRIVSLHTFKNNVLQQHLFILDGSEVVYRDLLNSDIQKLQPEAFVLHKNVLVYIKNRTEINVLNL